MFKNNSSDIFGRNPWGKFLGFLSFISFCLAGIIIISKIQTYDPISKEMVFSKTPFGLALLFFIICLMTGYLAYRLAGGKRNPVIWEDKDLHDLLRHATLSREAKIGFHGFRDQKILLDKLESVGLKKKASEDIRQFIRDKIVGDRRAFDICRDNIIIQMVHNGKEWFWDGYGNKKTAQYFHEAEIIFDLKSSAHNMFSGVFKDLKDAEKRLKEKTGGNTI